MIYDRRRDSPIWALIIYTLLAYVISWSVWGLWGALPDASPVVRTALFVLGGFGPFVAGFLLMHAAGQQLRPWLTTIFRVRIPAWYYIVALALPIGVMLVATVIHVVIFGGNLMFDELPAPIEYPLLLVIILLFGGGQEEPGWRGYLLPRLQESHSALTSALLIGVVWTGWHLPLFFLSGTTQSGLSLWLYLPNVVALSVILTWLTNSTGGSVVPAMVLHAGGNAIVNYYPPGGAAVALTPVGYGLLTVTVIAVAVTIVATYGPEQLAPTETSSGSQGPGG